MLQFLNLLQTRGFIAGGRLAPLVSLQQFSSLSHISDPTKFPVVCPGPAGAQLGSGYQRSQSRHSTPVQSYHLYITYLSSPLSYTFILHGESEPVVATSCVDNDNDGISGACTTPGTPPGISHPFSSYQRNVNITAQATGRPDTVTRYQ